MEYFANELLLDLFEYLSTVELLQEFDNLNIRFNNLLFRDFRSVSQYDWNLICRQYLPSIVDHVQSLRLSNDDDTPQQIDIFLQNSLTIRRFNRLQSLALCDICSNEIMNKMMLEWKYLPHLTHLTLAGCYLQFDQINGQCLINSIWSLPKLIYCYLNINFGEIDIFLPTVMSLSLKYLFIWGIEHHPNDINSLLKQTPCLKQFSILLNMNLDDDVVVVRHPALSITKLKLHLSRIHQDNMIIFLQTMPNLCQLIVDICSPNKDQILNGYQWENILRNYLPNLQIFRLRMEFQIINKNNTEKPLNDLVNSFRNSFWLEDHHWFVRCHWNPINSSSSIYLYTLPYKFTDFKFNSSMIFKSTCPNDKNYLEYNHVNNLKYEISSIEKFVLSPIRFLNLNHLSIELPIDDQFWSVILKLDHVTSLDISINDHYDDIQSQLQNLINRIPRLYSLSFAACSTCLLEIFLFQIVTTSIRRLDLREYDRYFNDEQCIALSRSSLGIQCEILFIKIKNHRILLELISNMINLRTLNIQCEDDKLNKTNDDKIIQWLKYHLPSTCRISRDIVFHYDIQIWIR